MLHFIFRLIFNKVIASLFIFTILVLLFEFVFEVRKSIAIQKLRNQKSWVWYMRLFIITAFTWVPLFSLWFFNIGKQIARLDFLVLLIFALIFEYWYQTILSIKIENFSPMRFAAGSVGSKEDMF